MTLLKFLYGFFGGVLGFIFAAPLTLHEGWARLTQFREENPTTNQAYIFASFLIFPLLAILGILGTPLIAGYAAYRCSNEESLNPIVETFARPYQSAPDGDRFQANLNMGMLLGYSTILSLTSFTILNVLTGNAFGFMGAAGAGIYSLFGISHATVAQCLLGTAILSYMSALVGGALAAVTTIFSQGFFARDNQVAPPEPQYVELLEQPLLASRTPRVHPPLTTPSRLNIFTRFWKKEPALSASEMSFMRNGERDEEEVVVFTYPEPENLSDVSSGSRAGSPTF